MLVRPTFECCYNVWSPHTGISINKLEHINSRGAILILYSNPETPGTGRKKMLQVIKQQIHIDLHTHRLTLIYKTTHTSTLTLMNININTTQLVHYYSNI